MKSRLGILVALALLLALAGAMAGPHLRLEAGTVRYTAAAGTIVRGSATVSNESTGAARLLVYSADQKVDAQGNLTYVTATRQTDASSPSAWFALSLPKAAVTSLGNLPAMELGPRESATVSYTVAIPDNAKAGDHNLLLFFETVPEDAGKGASASVGGRLGARIVLRVKGRTFTRLAVEPFSVPIIAIGRTRYSFTIAQRGNLDQRVRATVSLLDRNAETIAEDTAIDGRTVFAGEQIVAAGTLPGGFGKATVRVEVTPLDFTGNPVDAGADTITETRTVWVVPLWALLAIAGIALGLAAATATRLMARRTARRTALA